jgi:hypothetical protein
MRTDRRDDGERHPLRILLAEDNIINQQDTALLRSLPGRCGEWPGRVEALKNITTVFMDVQMPELSGTSITYIHSFVAGAPAAHRRRPTSLIDRAQLLKRHG